MDPEMGEYYKLLAMYHKYVGVLQNSAKSYKNI